MKLSINCFVLGDTDGITINVPEKYINDDSTEIEYRKLTVSNFIGIIKNKVKHAISDPKNPSSMKLWQVDIDNESCKKISTEKDIENKFNGKIMKRTYPFDGTVPTLRNGKKRGHEDSDDESEVQAKKERLTELEKDTSKILSLINSLDTINTDQQTFKVPPLPGDRKYTVIYNRQCYFYFREFILKDKDFKQYFITGNPGVEKTYFGRLLLIMLLKEKKTVLMDHKDFTLYIDPIKKVTFKVDSEEYKTLAQAPDTWCIIDGRAPQISYDYNGKFIMVSSPKKEIIKDFVKASKCKKMFMPTWKQDEISGCCKLLEIDETLVMKKFKLCGGIARLIFDSTLSRADTELMLGNAIESINADILYHQGQPLSGHEYTHKLIHIHTNIEKLGEYLPYTLSTCFFASKYVADKCLEKLQERHKKELFDFINHTKDISDMGSLRETLFEMVAHTIIRQGGNFRVRRLTKEGDGPECTHNFKFMKEEFFNDVSEIQGEKYFRPTSKNFESIDSFSRKNNLFQVTVAKKHSIKQEGLRAIHPILEEGEVRIYFVLSKDTFETFNKKQPYENKGKGLVFDDWVDDIVQYALCMNLKY